MKHNIWHSNNLYNQILGQQIEMAFQTGGQTIAM